MGAREQFAGWGYYDNTAVCLTCAHQHLIPKAEQVTDQPWLDWQAKHRGHETFIVPAKLLTRLGDQVAHLKHNSDVKIAYAASAAYTITLTGLATSSTLVAGRESTGLSNASNKYLDVLVAGFITVGTTPTANTQIEVHAVGALNDTPLYPDVFDGTDSAETVSNTGVKQACCRPIAIMDVTAATSDLAYPFAPLGIRAIFGDALPPAHALFVTHNTGTNLNATAANHAIYHTQVYSTVV
jgi:hypothetical protein